MKAAFRTFAKRFHPDKVGPAGEAHFIYVRDAYESLKDPVKRYAYDRYGFNHLARLELIPHSDLDLILLAGNVHLKRIVFVLG